MEDWCHCFIFIHIISYDHLPVQKHMVEQNTFQQIFSR
jgi:hypothetical protein